MSTFFGVIAVICWLGAVIGLAIRSLLPTIDHDAPFWPRGVPWAVASVVLFALPFGVFGIRSETEAMCARGHQEWRSTGRTTSRVWVCEEYQR